MPGDPKAIEHQLRVHISSVVLTTFHHFAPGAVTFATHSDSILLGIVAAQAIHKKDAIHKETRSACHTAIKSEESFYGAVVAATNKTRGISSILWSQQS